MPFSRPQARTAHAPAELPIKVNSVYEQAPACPLAASTHSEFALQSFTNRGFVLKATCRTAMPWRLRLPSHDPGRNHRSTQTDPGIRCLTSCAMT
eukprot:7476452-Pyramimonas_sp.AAC.1